MPYAYLLIDLGILLVPLLLSLSLHNKYLQDLRAIIITILIVGTLFMTWGYIAYLRGHWDWNPEYIIGIRLLQIPVEEYLFFVATAFSCLFIWYAVITLIPNQTVSLPRWWYVPTIIMLITFYNFFTGKEYTQLALLICAIEIMYLHQTKWELITSIQFWIYCVLTFIPFLLFNFGLTSLPILMYGEKFITGIRITTIPIEDFVYSFIMVTLYVVVFEKFTQKWGLSKN
ncbi:lycopene cyclase domain-containing protein [candidate division WWE3 bacterium]|nr:lycopene cyclase domain-containing protein [candidate division WWE3 bacterium]